ncbi:MAG: Na+/H+ antiporter NhaA [Acidobacteria bacterium]|nr:Na+/H+ antiporter NhaA [Acidobacteriota bacterium]
MAQSVPKTGVVHFILDNSLLLIGGTIIALVWANLNAEAYEHFAHSIHFAVNDVGMVFFFALAAKEVVEAMLPGGPLASPKQAAVPIFAAVGGMAAPAGLFLLAAYLIGDLTVVRGWAIPCATDIAFSYLVARTVFPAGHPAIPFLLLLAIADDAMGLIILAVFYPSGALAIGQLALWMAAALAMAWLLRRQRVGNFWIYLMGPGVLSWIALYVGGLHPALALVPIVPFMPHAKTDLGLFSDKEDKRHDTMNEFEHWWKAPVQVVLLLFGLVNAGVPLSAVGEVTWMVLGSLVIGKPLGIVGFALLAGVAGFPRARGLNKRALVVLGIAAGIGFTVALFFTTAAFPADSPHLDEAKMGALLSFLAAPLAIGVARMWRVWGPAAELKP